MIGIWTLLPWKHVVSTYLRGLAVFVKIVTSEILDFWVMGHLLAAKQVVFSVRNPPL